MHPSAVIPPVPPSLTPPAMLPFIQKPTPFLTVSRTPGNARGVEMPLGHHSPVLFPLWPQIPTPLPSGTCYSWNTKSCSSQIRPAQDPGEERQPRARLFLKK